MKKIMIVFGTRPEAIKMCPVVNEIKNRNTLEPVVVVSGQHKEMLYQVLDIFKVVPDYDLDIMKPNQSLFDITTTLLIEIQKVILKESPEIILVHGDTTTTFVVSLAAFYLKTPIGHVEAGLRTYNLYSPFPEEYNRQAVGIISQYNFAPTLLAKENLLKEGKREDTIFVVGNTVIDALKTTITENYSHPLLEWAKGSRLILLTAHRRENIGSPMRKMFIALNRVLETYNNVKIIYPIHLNPQVREIAKEILITDNKMKIIEPLDVFDFHNFMAKSYLIITDSGGIQEEAPSLGIPVLVMRDTTERPEGITAGTLKLVGTDEETIYNNVTSLLDDEIQYKKMQLASNPYGDGTSSKKIVDIIEDKLGK